MTRPELHIAVPGTKNTASKYNENFDLMLNYIDDSIDAEKTYVNNLLSQYETVNSLATSGTITLDDNTINTITPQGNVTFSLPTVTATTKFHQILVQMNLTSTYTISLGTTYYFDNVQPLFTATGLYDIVYEYDNASGNWVVGAIYKGTAV